MPRYFVRETFFRLEEEFARQQSALPAALYNALQLLLKRSGRDSLFIPIRTMQYQAVMERNEIVFVDSNGGYAHQDGEGGRLIRIAWRPAPAAERDSLDAPVPCEIVYYFPDLKETQWRLMSELPPLLKKILERQRASDLESAELRVIPFRRRG
jgi:hypothetical protein